MSINLTTYLTGKDVTPTEDAIVYEYATNDDGIIYGCDVSVKTDNKIFVDGGHGIFRGRKFTVLEETISVPLSPSGTKKKKLIIRMDLANQANPIQFLIVDSGYKLTQQANLNLTNGVWELELATMSVTNTAVTNLKQTFTLLKRGKPTVTVDDVVGLDTEITKLEEADKKINGDVTKLKTDKADKSKAQMHKLTQDNGRDTNVEARDVNTMLDTGNFYIKNVAINGKFYNGYLTVHAHDDYYVKQTFTERDSGKTYVRVYVNKVWNVWQKLGGIDAKVYDIVLLNGAKPSRYATENDNKIIRIGDTAYMHARLDLREVADHYYYPKILKIPKQLTPTANERIYSLRKYLVTPTTITAKYPQAEAKDSETLVTGESENVHPSSFESNGSLGYERITANKCSDVAQTWIPRVDRHKATDWCGSFAWYVGEVN